MGIQRDRGRNKKQWATIESPSEYINSNSEPHSGVRRFSRNWNGNKFLRQLRLLCTKQFHNKQSRRSISIYPELSRSWDDESNNNSKSNNYRVRHRYNKYIYPVIATLLSVQSVPLRAEGVGGVSATANPIANSSGSVTNQAIQVLQGPYITNTYGGGVQCQGATFNLTPYLQFSDSRKDPWEDFFQDPQYNLSDFSGRTIKQQVTVKNYPWETWYDTRTKADGSRWFEDGADMVIEQDVDTGDGIPDQTTNGVLDPIWYKPIRTDMKANQNFNIGLSATLSIPLDKKLGEQCKQAADAQIAAVIQGTANKRLDFEIARLKNCGELMKAGIFFHPKSPYHAVCADVVVTAPGGTVQPHSHSIPKPEYQNPISSDGTASDLGVLSIGDIDLK